MPEDRTEHLKLCRELYNQLRRIHAHQEHDQSAVATSLPINFPMFMKNFDLYLKWVERNSKVVDIAVRRPPVRTVENSEPA
jgi:hypothetical protein